MVCALRYHISYRSLGRVRSKSALIFSTNISSSEYTVTLVSGVSEYVCRMGLFWRGEIIGSFSFFVTSIFIFSGSPVVRRIRK